LLAAKALKLVESEPRYDALVKAVRNALNVGEGKVGEADR